MACMAYNTTDAAGMLQYLRNRSVEGLTDLRTGADGSRWFQAKDPEGNQVQFIQLGKLMTLASDAKPIGTHIIHAGYLVHSRTAEDRFYKELLGFRPYWFGAMQPDHVDWISQQVPDGRDWIEYMMVGDGCSRVPRLMANPLGLPIGLQLYSVRDLLPKDYEGTLRQLGALGYREVEAAGFFGHSPSEVKQAMDRAGLRCVSAHYPLKDLLPKVEEVIQFGKDLGLQYIVGASPWFKDPSRVKDPGSRAARDAMTLDDWRWNAEQFNHIGERVSAAGIRFAYHNHTATSTAYLDEAERCHRVALLHQGKLLFFDTPANLKAKLGKDVASIISPESRRVHEPLERAEGLSSLMLTGDGVHVVVDDAQRRIPQFEARLKSASISFATIRQVTPSIEDLFVDAVTAGEEGERSTPRREERF
jgi:catechol 2,3-dioxygenase-like lactoylglutathione lyase family enzyme